MIISGIIFWIILGFFTIDLLIDFGLFNDINNKIIKILLITINFILNPFIMFFICVYIFFVLIKDVLNKVIDLFKV